MAGKRCTRYHQDPQFRAAIEAELDLANAEDAGPDVWITYAIHDPSREDPRGNSDGLIVYVGQSKQFNKRVRKRLLNAGTATSRPSDRIDGYLYGVMQRGFVPRFRILERVSSAIDSLVSETNWTKRLRALGYPLLNQWAEQKTQGAELSRSTIPHNRLWPLTASDAQGSGIDVIITNVDGSQSFVLDLSEIPTDMRLRDIRSNCTGRLDSLGRTSRVRLLVR